MIAKLDEAEQENRKVSIGGENEGITVPFKGRKQWLKRQSKRVIFY